MLTSVILSLYSFKYTHQYVYKSYFLDYVKKVENQKLTRKKNNWVLDDKFLERINDRWVSRFKQVVMWPKSDSCMILGSNKKELRLCTESPWTFKKFKIGP